MKSNTIPTHNGSIFYKKTIIGSQYTLVCIHGAGGDSKLFFPLIAEMKDVCSIIAPDLPGHGKSVHSGVPTFEDYINSLTSIINYEGLSVVIPVGFSMGGAFAFELYRRFPEKIPAIALISSGTTLPVSEVVFNLIQTDYAAFCDFLVKFLYSRKADDILKKMSRQELSKVSPAIMENDFRICAQIDYRDMASSIRIPVLIIANKKDRMMPFELFEESKRLLPRCTLSAFEDEGHMPHVENPKAVAREIRNFLNDENVL
jgi:pimeloyl-ACP methyl ester carboxylesterase